jgi:hypothetical protein
MKKLQQNFTTTEQSKRLLELGVPANSADCYLNSDSIIVLNGKTFQENYNEDLDLARLHLIEYPHYIPCWSVGRLMEIFDICIVPRNYTNWMNTERIPVRYITYIIDCYERSAQHQQLDFSKLEE